jgi:hypothetical protein
VGDRHTKQDDKGSLRGRSNKYHPGMRARTIALVAASLAVAACGPGQAANTGQHPAARPSATSSSWSQPLTVSEALSVAAGADVVVQGALVAKGNRAELCDWVEESYPPQCEDPRLKLEGIDLSQLRLQRKADTSWGSIVAAGKRTRDGLNVTAARNGK